MSALLFDEEDNVREEWLNLLPDISLVHAKSEHVLSDIGHLENLLKPEVDILRCAGFKAETFLKQNVNQSSNKHGPIVA
jgi:hypothetical protein